jgi:phage-related tail protein
MTLGFKALKVGILNPAKKRRKKAKDLRDKPIEKWTKEDWKKFSEELASLEEVGVCDPIPIF